MEKLDENVPGCDKGRYRELKEKNHQKHRKNLPSVGVKSPSLEISRTLSDEGHKDKQILNLALL